MKPKKVNLKTGVKWEVDFYLNGRGSKRKRKRFDKKQDAELFIKEYLRDPKKVVEKDEANQEKRTFYSESLYWLNTRGIEVSTGHLQRVQGIINRLNKDYATYPIRKFDHALLARIRKSLLEKNLSKATTNRWINAICAIINHSFEHRRIVENPTIGFKLLKESRDEINFWEEEEVKSFLGFAKREYQNKTGEYWKYVAYLCALNTGIRAGELWGLKVKDINASRNSIKINRQFNRASGKITPTKGKDTRLVPCNKTLLKELQKIIAGKQLDDFVFTNQNGKAVCHNNFRSRSFNTDLEGCGVREIRFHDLRHTALTLMVGKGVNLKTVQYIAGHKDITTTMKYVHLLGGSVSEVAKIFEMTC